LVLNKIKHSEKDFSIQRPG